MALKKDYDIIISDINMPVMNGYEFCQKIVNYYDNEIQVFN